MTQGYHSLMSVPYLSMNNFDSADVDVQNKSPARDASYSSSCNRVQPVSLLFAGQTNMGTLVTARGVVETVATWQRRMVKVIYPL